MFPIVKIINNPIVPTHLISKLKKSQGEGFSIDLNLVTDTIKFSNEALEHILKDEVWKYGQKHGVETARFTKNNNRLPIKTKETKAGIEFPDLTIQELYEKLKDSTVYHYHPVDLPLSCSDLSMLFESRMKKVSSISKNKKFSDLEIPLERRKEPLSMLYGVEFEPYYMRDNEDELLKKLGLYSEDEDTAIELLLNAPKDKLKEISDFRIEQIETIAENYGLIFKHNFD